MDTKTDIRQAVAEAGTYLAHFPGLAAGVDVIQLSGEYRAPLTLGTIQALYELAADIVGICDQYGPEVAARVARTVGLQVFLTT